MAMLLIALLFMLSAIAFFGALVALFFKKRRKKAKWIAIGSAATFILSIVLISNFQNNESRIKGFVDFADEQAAKKAGVTDVAAWQSQRQKAEAEISAKAEIAAKAHAAEATALAEKQAAAIERRAALLRPPLKETQFIDAVTRAQSQYRSGENELQKGAARPNRAREICAVLSDATATNWIGTIADLSTNGDGNGVLSIKLSPRLHLKTWNNSISDYNTNTLIKSSSGLYRDLLTWKVGETVRFSGSFFRKDDPDCLLEQSMTLAGSINDPEFVFRFSQVERVELPEQSATR
jgi:hypothetical protein